LNDVYNSFDIVGDIVILKVANNNVGTAEAIAKQIMAVHRSIKTVFVQISPILGDFRVRELKLVAGEAKTTTKYRESGCVFEVDVKKCYFSPRLSHERARIAKLVKNGETVVNMFAGVGCFSVIIAKTTPTAKVFSIDVNPAAFNCMVENVKINRVYDEVVPLFGDSKDVIEAELQGKADRVLMPLPEKALEYLPCAILALKPSSGWIHLYDFQHATGNESPIEKTKQNVAQKLRSLGVDYSFVFSRVVRSTGPNWYQTVLDIEVNKASGKF
jgi:tRNA (guanine37-N1)-methyltransferase